MLLRSLVALVSGAVLTLAFEPYAIRAVIPFSLAALMLATRGLPVRRSWLPGLLFGAAFMGSLQTWMIAIGPDAWVGITLLEAVFFGAFGAGLGAVQRLPYWPWWAAALWVAVESVRVVWPFSGMPWGRLSYAVADSWWAQLLPYAGFTLVSFVLALTGGSLAWLVVGGWRRPGLVLGAATGLALMTLAPVMVPYEAPVDGQTVVAVVQGDVPGDGTNVLYDHRQVTANQRDVTQQVADDAAAGRVPPPDFVLWPENSTAVDPFLDAEVNATIQDASAAAGVPILVGALTEGAEPGTVLNQGIVWEPGIGATDRYTKWHPVPFGEYIPWRGRGPMQRFQNFGRLQEIGRDMPGGSRVAPVRIGGIKVADAICFDVGYDDVFASQLRGGAQMIVVQTSNAMFINTNQIEQQFEITRLRALASGRSLAVSSTNGISAILSPTGEELARAGTRTKTALVQQVPLATQVPLGVLLGAWPAWLVTAVAVGAVAASLRRGGSVTYRRRDTDPRSRHAPALVPAGTPADESGS